MIPHCDGVTLNLMSVQSSDQSQVNHQTFCLVFELYYSSLGSHFNFAIKLYSLTFTITVLNSHRLKYGVYSSGRCTTFTWL
jgi:hypothetical protein